MSQLDLLKARSRNTDPVSSHAAAESVEGSGRAKLQRRVILDLVAKHPGRHARELSLLNPFDNLDEGGFRAALYRRLAELSRAGLIHSTQTGTAPMRYWIGPARPQ